MMETNDPNAGAAAPSSPARGELAPQPGPGQAVGGVGMPRSFQELDRGWGAPAAGGTLAAAAESARRQLSDLSKRVLSRWGSVPFKGMALLFGVKVGVSDEDSELLGEVTVDAVAHSAFTLDPATEARWRCAFAYGLAAGEGFLAAWERSLEERAKKLEKKPDA